MQIFSGKTDSITERKQHGLLCDIFILYGDYSAIVGNKSDTLKLGHTLPLQEIQ